MEPLRLGYLFCDGGCLKCIDPKKYGISCGTGYIYPVLYRPVFQYYYNPAPRSCNRHDPHLFRYTGLLFPEKKIFKNRVILKNKNPGRPITPLRHYAISPFIMLVDAAVY